MLSSGGLNYLGKADGSYSQTRQGQSYSYLPLQNQHIGLPYSEFRTDMRLPQTVAGIAQDVVMADCSDQKTMIRSLETVQDTSVQRK